MPTFALEYKIKPLDIVNGNKVSGIRPKFFMLVKNGDIQFERYCNEIIQRGQNTAYLKRLITTMDNDSNLIRLPDTKFKNITRKKSTFKEYEYKADELRTYAIHIENVGRIIVVGGFKNTQRSDIKQFHEIIKQLAEYLINHELCLQETN